MYYNIVESGIRIKELRLARNITRQQLADEVGINFLVCGCEKKAEIDSLLAGLNNKEVQVIRNIVLSIIENMNLLRET